MTAAKRWHYLFGLTANLYAMTMFFSWLLVLLTTALRYLLFAVISYAFFYRWRKYKYQHNKIQPAYPAAKMISTELRYSLSTLLVFSLVIAVTIYFSRLGYSRMYFDRSERPGWWFWLSIALLILLHDFYFYWTHRLMHHKHIFKYVHHIHHRSHNPTPLAAFSFHPLEALVEIGILPLAVMVMPLHPIALGVFGVYMMALNVVGHLGFEFYPRFFLRKKWLRWHNTSTHHNMHHHYGKFNFSLYFNIWDRLMGTNHPHYQEEFERAAAKKDAATCRSPKNPAVG